MRHLEGSGTPVLYIWDAGFLKVKGLTYQKKNPLPVFARDDGNRYPFRCTLFFFQKT